MNILRKLKGTLIIPVQYEWLLDNETASLNSLIGKKIRMHFKGEIYCIQCGRKTSKSFQQGYCFPCMRKLQECDMCMLHPERCHVEQGSCSQDDWAHAQCDAKQIIYLANSSALKVGITRESNVPMRWIDQGAVQALPILKAPNRYRAGLAEVAIKKYVSDKTNWQAMLKGSQNKIDLLAEKARLLNEAQAELAPLFAAENAIELIDDAHIIEIEYPVLQYPKKITNLSFDKTPVVEGILQGIKGQYLILDTGVINIRKFGGYLTDLSVVSSTPVL